jgi:uncharacterized protein YdeI (YjbR/CyaY-like superfamily)
MITEIEDYFTKGCGRCTRFATADCSVQHWLAGLVALRAICCSAGLVETVKWGHPCYMHSGRNIAIVGAFRGDFRLTFFDAALLKDPEAVLQKQGEQTRHADMIRFTKADQVAALAPTIRAYLAEAMGYAEAGIRPEKVEHENGLPEELVEALDSDPELAEAFHRLTPGRQKSHVLQVLSTANPATRRARIIKARDKILAGKGATER